MDFLERRRPIAAAPQPGAAGPGDRPGRPSAGHGPLQLQLRRSPCVCSRARSKRSAAISFCAACAPPNEHRRTRGATIPTPTAWCHGEADLLPALVVDRYGDYLVLQTLDQGMDAATGVIVDCLEEIFHPARHRGAQRRRRARPRRSCRSNAGVLCGRGARCRHRAHERPRSSRPTCSHGQKTGIYLDQRENYLRRRALRPRRRGARLLHLHRRLRPAHGAAKCDTVEAVDSSGRRARRRAPQRRGQRHRQHRVPRSRRLRPADRLRRRAPPLLHGRAGPAGLRQVARSLDAAVRGYKEINLRALRLLEPGGILVTCSCSHHLSEATLLEIVAEAALDAGRTPARPRAPHPGAGPPHPAHRARNPLPEVPDPGGPVRQSSACLSLTARYNSKAVRRQSQWSLR